MAEHEHLETCFLCQGSQFGPHAYNGRWIRAWNIVVCNGCLDGNYDGIVPGTYPHLLDYLKARGIEPQYNDQGWIRWPLPN